MMTRFRSWTTTAFASMQWLFFIFANTVVVPISVGAAFDLPAHDIAGILRSSLIFTGVACVLQGWVGHRLPLMEGHSGMMWGLMLNLSVSAHSLGMTLTEVGGGIASGILLAGITVVLLAAVNGLGFMQKIFNPMVMSVFLFLLTFQLMKIFFEGMLVVSEDGTLDLPVSLFSVGVAAFVCFVKIKGKEMIGNFSILIGIVVGWALYALIFPASAAAEISSSWHIPIFPFGAPNLKMSIILTTFIAVFINLSNTVVSIQTAADLFRKKATRAMFNRSYFLTGLYTIIAAVFGLVSYAPYTSSIGFLESTRNFERKPFLIGGAWMALLGIIPPLGGLLAAMPITVGNAVLFAAYMQLFGTSVKSISGYAFNSVTIHRLAVPVLAGMSILHMDVSLFSHLPELLQPLLSNGFIVGVLISVVMELTMKWDQPELEDIGIENANK